MEIQEKRKDTARNTIMQGVCITLLIKNPKSTNKEAEVYHTDIYAKKDKLKQLLEISIRDINPYKK